MNIFNIGKILVSATTTAVTVIRSLLASCQSSPVCAGVYKWHTIHLECDAAESEDFLLCVE